MLDWVAWLFRWLAADATRVPDLMRESALKAATTPAEWATAAATGDYGPLLPGMLARLTLWMQGAPLVAIEASLADAPAPGEAGEPKRRGGKRAAGDAAAGVGCDRARGFYAKAVHELSYVAGLVTHVRRGQLEHDAATAPSVERVHGAITAGSAASQNAPPAGAVAPMSTALAVLTACVREGVDSPEALAVLYALRDPTAPRARVHATLARVRPVLDSAGPSESFGDTRRRVATALAQVAETGTA